MRVNPKDLTSFLYQPPPQIRGFLCYGFDQGLARERIANIIKKIPASEVITLDGEEEKELVDKMQQGGLFNDKIAIMLNNADKISQDIIKVVLNFDDQSNYLLCRSGSLRQGHPLLTAFSKQENLAAIACYPDEGQKLEYFLRQELKKHNLSISSMAFESLLNSLGEDREQNRLELEKIFLAAKNDKESLDQIIFEAVEGGGGNYSLGKMVNAIFEGRSDDAYKLASAILNEDITKYILIIRSIMRHAEQLLIAKEKLFQGLSEEEALKVFPYLNFRDKPHLTRQIQSLSIAMISLIEQKSALTEELLRKGFFKGGPGQKLAILQLVASCLEIAKKR